MARIVVLTGAGISAESGLPTFRSVDGLWEGRRPEDVATPQAFARDPGLVQRFYNARRHTLQTAPVQPNAAHRALARLEAGLNGEVLIVTQNVDDLHERAGSRSLIHMHGELLRARCLACGESIAWRDDITPTRVCARCAAAGRLRPDVVWFGEMPRGLDAIETALATCALFVSIGTSGQVYPAAGFAAAVRGRAHTIEINLERTVATDAFAEHRAGAAAFLVPVLVEELLTERR